VRGTHVQAQEPERREIAFAQQAEFHVLGRGLRVLCDRGSGPEQEKKKSAVARIARDGRERAYDS